MGVVDSIREFNNAVPFVPYEIHMASGGKYLVPHPDFALIAPLKTYVIVADANNRPHHLNAILIERASPKISARKGGRRAA
jgi:hypothetical protein